MRISELIKRLENIKSEHGDLYVLIGQPDCTGEGDDDLVDMTGECMTLRKRWRQYPKAWRHLRSAVVRKLPAQALKGDDIGKPVSRGWREQSACVR